MNVFLTLAFLLFIGSVTGWCLEVVFRKYFSSSNPEHKWINPGFCTGPYLPIYGFGLCSLYLIAGLESFLSIETPVLEKAVLFLIMAVSMTAIEYVAGILSLKVFKVRLWDYSDEWGNLQGIICPRFSLIWALMGALYYFLIHPKISGALAWLSDNLAFSFVIGFFFGVFLLDAANSAELVIKLRQWAKNNNIIVRYEALKIHIRRYSDTEKKKYRFYHPFHSDRSLTEHLKEMQEALEQRTRRK